MSRRRRVVDRRGEATISGEPEPLCPATAVFLRLGETLALENRSDTEPLRYFIVKAQHLGALTGHRRR